MDPDCKSETPSSPTVYGPDPFELAGRRGCRYWVQHPFAFTGHLEVDDRLSGYPVAIFQPHGRPAHDTPLVIGLQGLGAPFQWNDFLIPTLLDRGIACLLFDTPGGGERSLARSHDGDVLGELQQFTQREVPVSAGFVVRLFEAVARDFRTVLDLAAERHGLTADRLALFGVSLGTLLSAFAFTRDGIGTRLLGTIGHANLPRFACSYAPWFRPLLTWLPDRLLGWVGGWMGGDKGKVGLSFVRVLHELSFGDPAVRAANPMTYLHRVSRDRRVRFLVGGNDPRVRPRDAIACARRFPDGDCYVVPGLDHGGPDFITHARYFVSTQLGDWCW